MEQCRQRTHTYFCDSFVVMGLAWSKVAVGVSEHGDCKFNKLLTPTTCGFIIVTAFLLWIWTIYMVILVVLSFIAVLSRPVP